MDNDSRSSALKRWGIRLFTGGMILLPLWFVYQRLTKQWADIHAYEFSWQPIPIVAGILILIIAFACLPLATQYILKALGTDLSYSAAYYAYFITQLTKYLPGGLWVIPGRTILLTQLGVPLTQSSSTVILEVYFLILTGLLSFTPYLFFYEPVQYTWLLKPMVVGIPLLLLLVHPRFLRWFFQWLPWQKLRLDMDVSLWNIVKILLIDCFFWVGVGSGLFWLIRGVYPTLAFSQWLPIISAFSLSWVLGFLSFLTPAGLGIREGALAILLTPLLPAPLPALIALLARLWWMGAELVSVAFATFIHLVKYRV